MLFFRVGSFELGLILFGVVLGTTLLGVLIGRRLRHHVDALREPFGVVQAALAGLVALLLAFGLTMAVGRYDARRAAVVSQANTIGTTYLRAQTLREPMRTPGRMIAPPPIHTSDPIATGLPNSACRRCAASHGCIGV